MKFAKHEHEYEFPTRLHCELEPQGVGVQGSCGVFVTFIGI